MKEPEPEPTEVLEEPPSWREVLEVLALKLSGEQLTRRVLLQRSGERRAPEPETLEMVEGALRIAKRQVRDIMVPRIRMRVLRENAPVREWVRAITESGHSRFPVLQEDSEQVIGILIAKDLLTLPNHLLHPNPAARDLLRNVNFVPESKRLNSLLREFRSSRSHMAIVVDEYDGIAGLVTIEDIIEEIVGEIEDEHDPAPEAHILPAGDNVYAVNGLTPIGEFNEHFHTSLEDGDYETVGGLVLKRCGRMPGPGYEFQLDGLHFTVLKADKRRVHVIRIRVDRATTRTAVVSDSDST